MDRPGQNPGAFLGENFLYGFKGALRAPGPGHRRPADSAARRRAPTRPRRSWPARTGGYQGRGNTRRTPGEPDQPGRRDPGLRRPPAVPTAQAGEEGASSRRPSIEPRKDGADRSHAGLHSQQVRDYAIDCLTYAATRKGIADTSSLCLE